MDDLESKIAALSPAKRALLERTLREKMAHVETDSTRRSHHWSSLIPVQPKGTKVPCFGAVVAFEMAQQLKGEGEHVALVFMLDPPGARQERASGPIQNDLRRRLRQLAVFGAGLKMHHLLLRVRSYASERTRWITKGFARLRWRYYLWAGHLLPVSLRSPYILDIYRQATRSYKPKPYLGSVVVFKAQPGAYKPPLNWLQLAAGRIEIHEYPADHMALRTEPQVRRWAVHLKESLDRAQKFVEAGMKQHRGYPAQR